MSFLGKNSEYYTDADDIMKRFVTKSINKWEVLNYFASAKTGNLEAFSNLLHSKYYTQAEIFQHFKTMNNVRFWMPEASEVLKEYFAESKEQLKNGDNLYMFLLYRNIFLTNHDEDQKLSWLEENKDKLSAEDIGWKTFDVLADPNLGFDSTLKKVLTLELFSRENVKARFDKYDSDYYNPTVETYISNNWWQLFESSSPALQKLDEKQKFEALEFYAKQSTESFDKFVNNVKFTHEELYDKYKHLRKEGTPKVLFQYIYPIVTQHRRELIEKRKHAREELWINDDGKLRDYFRLSNQQLITSKEDYVKILEAYANSGLSVGQFCSAMKIEDVVGFYKCLSRYQATNEDFANLVVQKRIEAQKKLIQDSAEFVQKIAKGEMTVGEYLQQSKKPATLENLKNLSVKMYGDERSPGTIAFLKNVIAYYYKRLNSYDSSLKHSEEVSKMLTPQEIQFILGKEGTNKSATGKPMNLEDIFRKITAPVGVVEPKFYNFTVLGSEQNKVLTKMTDYKYPFDAKEFFSGTTELILSDGRIKKADQETFAKAYHYLTVNNIYKGNGVMRKTMRLVLENKIEVQDDKNFVIHDTNAEKMEKLKKSTTVEEYLENAEIE